MVCKTQMPFMTTGRPNRARLEFSSHKTAKEISHVLEPLARDVESREMAACLVIIHVHNIH
jgi:hypothetical protein